MRPPSRASAQPPVGWNDASFMTWSPARCSSPSRSRSSSPPGERRRRAVGRGAFVFKYSPERHRGPQLQFGIWIRQPNAAIFAWSSVRALASAASSRRPMRSFEQTYNCTVQQRGGEAPACSATYEAWAPRRRQEEDGAARSLDDEPGARLGRDQCPTLEIRVRLGLARSGVVQHQRRVDLGPSARLVGARRRGRERDRARCRRRA